MIDLDRPHVLVIVFPGAPDDTTDHAFSVRLHGSSALDEAARLARCLAPDCVIVLHLCDLRDKRETSRAVWRYRIPARRSSPRPAGHVTR